MTDPVELPGSHRRYDCPPDEYRLILDTAIPELVRSGLSADTRDIAVGAGVPPTHPLLRDTRVLYDEAIRFAFRRLWPRPEDLDVERLVPAEAVRSLVRTAYRRHRANPDAVRLIISENVLSRTHLEGRSDVLESSPVVLQIDRVLMRGQDYGAFRPGISAEDVYVLITSLCCFPASQGTMFQLLYGTDMDHAATVDGLEKLACDTVLAFLTTSMPTTQGSSYTHAAPTTTTPSSVSASLYTAGDGGSVEEVVTYRPEDLPDFTEPEDAPDTQPFPPYDAYADDLGEQGLDDRDGADDDDGTVDDHIAALYDD
ncbi:Transcriptional regulator, TetR-family [Corynebacterium glyciniphilum AJ 3170]|uniref:Transcriptional regulator, TetR-family n=1 Tax=Corynebacterium glyciniphilum AJ 3170 TaxID=1404245 RepID=X5DNL9_9CORY|nr:TetR family transcriptional regulator [Corynebacterium glyciniphilum]AHW64748.1 Transcriptional regulator, TetR-family [Corynebacterium glyciniphilum AJ 3170]